MTNKQLFAVFCLLISVLLAVSALILKDAGDTWRLCALGSCLFLIGFLVMIPSKNDATLLWRRVFPLVPGLILGGIGTAMGFSYSVDSGSVVVLSSGSETIKVVDKPGEYFKPIWYEAKSFPTRWEWSASGTHEINNYHGLDLEVKLFASIEVIEGELDDAMKAQPSGNFDDVILFAFDHVLKFMKKEEILQLYGSGSRTLLDKVNQNLLANHIRVTRCRVSGSAFESHFIDAQQPE